MQLKWLEYAGEVPQARRFNSFGHRHIEIFLWSKLLKQRRMWCWFQPLWRFQLHYLG